MALQRLQGTGFSVLLRQQEQVERAFVGIATYAKNAKSAKPSRKPQIEEEEILEPYPLKNTGRMVTVSTRKPVSLWLRFQEQLINIAVVHQFF